MTLKSFSPKKSLKKLAILTQIYAIEAVKKDHNIGCVQKHIFSSKTDESRRK
jgi:hypothetical protein